MSQLCLLGAIIVAAAVRQDPPTIRLTADNTVIDRSCRIDIAPGAVIEDADGNGVVHIGASGIVIEFAPGSVLRGCPEGRRPDEYKGYGIRLAGHSNVTIRNARISGYWCAIWASRADGLTLDAIDASDNRRAFLRSTPAAEDGGDWLFPHDNDNNEWLTNYGAALYVEDSSNLTVCNCRVRHGQNALCLDRVRDSRVFDNDFSFNSGWGLAMWRCEGNIICYNAIDFCVRGYSHGVYNRGQDSAGILMFEQNNRNIIAHNSVTHGGDGFFGFAGREAIAETGQHPLEWYRRRGNCDNILFANDFSYAPAHGIEMTFSFGNRFINNRIVENAICGVWAGYSQDTLIAGNHFEGNGQMGYGLERGGVNIEHGSNNRILQNRFVNNRCGVHLWGGPNPDFQQRPWGKANGIDSTKNIIAANRFEGDNLALHFRGPGDVTLSGNEMRNVGKEIEVEGEHAVSRASLPIEPLASTIPDLPGKTRPVAARPHLRGRDKIIMTEWGPWDHESPLVRQVASGPGQCTYELHKMPGPLTVRLSGPGLTGQMAYPPDAPPRYTIRADRPGLHSYTLAIQSGTFSTEVRGTLLVANWRVAFFPWTGDLDPREKLDLWRKLASGESAISIQLDQISLRYGMGGPGDLHLPERQALAKLGGDHFGMIATTTLALPAGRWRFKTLSDDGVRVAVDGKPIIENWTWHGPTADAGILELPKEKPVSILVEHFEIDGYATLELQIEPAE